MNDPHVVHVLTDVDPDWCKRPVRSSDAFMPDLTRLNAMGIDFITPRKRAGSLLDGIAAAARADLAAREADQCRAQIPHAQGHRIHRRISGYPDNIRLPCTTSAMTGRW
ncbi:MAG: hypothetical protein OXF51_06310 [Alphaproteobacteria bacterium]|nr:hypothetical protein [Alphaproteobacteria bacterium]